MKVIRHQNEISESKKTIAIFMPYEGEHRCAKCVFQASDFCKRAPCTADERKDGLQGFFRAANKNAGGYEVLAEFRGLLR